MALGEQVGAEPPHGTIVEAEHGAVPLRRLDPARAEHEPRAAGPRGADRPDVPATAQPQMAPERDATLEPEQQMLPDRLDALEPTPVDGCGHAGDEPARMRRGGRHAQSDERTEPSCNAVEGVAFGHVE